MTLERIDRIADYFAGRNEIAAVFLFGSHASGKAGAFSDVDLGILLKRKDAKYADRHVAQYMTELSRRIQKDIHPVIMNFAGELIAKQIFSKGKCILVKDRKEISVYRTAMYSRIADFSVYLKRMKRGFVRNTIGA